MKVALVHDYLFTYGGAERVLEVLHEVWPDADVFTAWADFDWIKREKPEWQKWNIHTSWFQKIPFHQQLCSPLRFLTPWIWESFNLEDYDIVISSSAWYIPRGVVTKPDTLHLCYCHTPPRYLYGYPTAREFRKFFLGRLYAGIVNPFMRVYDYQAAQRVDKFVSNSEEVKRRIEKFYRREAEVVYPPVLIEEKEGNHVEEVVDVDDFYLMVNRLVRHKNVGLAIRACKKLERHLVIAGKGRDEKRLKDIAGGSEYIHFLGYVDDQHLDWLYKHCQAVLYLAKEEDFGITPVEAMSYGKPVIAYFSGGVKESVVEGKTGKFIEQLAVEELKEVLEDFSVEAFDKQEIKKYALQFGKEKFKKKIKQIVRE